MFPSKTNFFREQILKEFGYSTTESHVSIMTTTEILILDPSDHQLYKTTMRKLRRIDTEICRHRQSFSIHHQSHIQTVLHFLLLDLLAVELQVKRVKDKNLRIELRKGIVKRKQRYYELYDEVHDTIFLDYTVPLTDELY